MKCDITCNCHIFHQEVYQKINKQMPIDDDIEKMSQMLKVLSDPNRIKILKALSIDELCVCDLGHLLGVTKSAISHQMKLLKTHQLVQSRKEGKMVYYTLYDEDVKTFIQSAYNHVMVYHEKNN